MAGAHERFIGFLIEPFAGNFPLWLAPEQVKVHTMLVIGGRFMEAAAVSVRLHGIGNVGAKPKSEAVADVLAATTKRPAQATNPSRLVFCR